MDMQNASRQTFQGLRQRSLSGEVRDEIERMIFDGELRAGERLDETTLAKNLGVSRGPVREATRSLGQAGLVTSIANKGTFVRKLSLEEALELYDLRAMVAGYLCARVAESGDAQVALNLRRRITQMEHAARALDEAGYFELNLDFHAEIAKAAKAPRAARLYETLGKEVRLMRLRVLKGLDALTTSNEEHDDIVRAIERQDVEAARQAGAAHHVNGRERLLSVL